MNEIRFTDILLEPVQVSECITEGSKYKCILIKAGETTTANKVMQIEGKNVLAKKYYTSEAIKNAVEKGLFEGCPALVRDVNEHLNNDNTGINSYVGNFSGVTFNESMQCAEGILNISGNSELSQRVKAALGESIRSGLNIGLSFAGQIKGMIQKVKDYYSIVVSEIESLQSVDIVPKGNAGGKIVALIAEAEREFLTNHFNNLKTGESQMNQEIKQKIFDLLNAAGLIGEGKTIESVKDEDLLFALYQHVITLSNTQGTSVAESEKAQKFLNEAINSGTATIKSLVAEAQKLASQNYLTFKLGESKLPQPVKDKIKAQYGDETLSNEKIDSIFVAEQNALAALNPAFVNNGGADIKFKKDEFDKYQLQMDYAMFDPSTFRKMSAAEQAIYKDVASHVSFKELYRKFTGDVDVTGKIFAGAMGEAIESSTFANILGVSMHRSLLAEYRTSPYNADWRKVASIVPRNDFKTNTVTNLGGYDDFPTVAESGPYTAATSPGEEAATYALLKRGYSETISMEAIRNDDLGAIRRIPVAWGRAAMRTLYKYVFNMIITNPTIGTDSKALFHVDHSNKLTDALSETAYIAARKLLAQQVDKTSAAIIGFAPKYLLVSVDNEKVAYNLTVPAFGTGNAVPSFIQTWRVEPIVVTHATGASWYLSADPSEGAIIELGFLDGNEEPELFTQDLPTQGYAFTNDGIKMKVRHIYAGTNVDHRPIVGSIVG